MRKKWLKNSIFFTTAIMLIASSVACGGKTGNTSQTTSTVVKQPDKITVMANFANAEPNEWDKAVIDLLEKKANVKLNFEIPPNSNYKEKLQITLVSGTYPDLIQFTDPGDSTYQSAMENGVLMPLDDLMKTAPNIAKYSYDNAWPALMNKTDNKIYAIPRATILRTEGFIVRKDWLKNVGLTYPTDGKVTLEEFENILRAFTNKDPNMNGKKDTYGFAGLQDASTRVMQPFIKDYFGVFGWRDNGEKTKYIDLQYSKENDSYKKLLEETVKLFKEGVADPDSALNTQKVALDRFKQGLTGVIKDSPTNVFLYEGQMKPTTKEAELGYISIKNSKGIVTGQAIGGSGIWGCWAISKTFKAPEAVMRMFNWLLSDEGWKVLTDGVEGVSYKVENGKKIYNMDLFTNKDWSAKLTRRKNPVDVFLSPANTDEQNNNLKKWLNNSLENAISGEDLGFIPEAGRSQQYLNYQKTYQEGLAKILLNAIPVSDYDKLLDGWYKAGGEDYIKQMNEYIQKIKK